MAPKNARSNSLFLGGDSVPTLKNQRLINSVTIQKKDTLIIPGGGKVKRTDTLGSDSNSNYSRGGGLAANTFKIPSPCGRCVKDYDITDVKKTECE